MIVVFDLDGTLVDSVADIHASVNTLMATLGAEPFPLAEVRGFIGNGVPTLIERAMAARGLSDPALLPGRIAVYAQHHGADPAGRTTPYPGVAAVLDQLTGAGHRLGLCTNRPGATAGEILARLDLARSMQTIVAGDTLPVRKPDPAPLRKAIAAIGEGPAVFVGDSEVDAETAEAAGVPFLLFTEGYRKAPVAAIPHHAAFSRFADLPGLLDRLAPTA